MFETEIALVMKQIEQRKQRDFRLKITVIFFSVIVSILVGNCFAETGRPSKTPKGLMPSSRLTTLRFATQASTLIFITMKF